MWFGKKGEWTEKKGNKQKRKGGGRRLGDTGVRKMKFMRVGTIKRQREKRKIITDEDG